MECTAISNINFMYFMEKLKITHESLSKHFAQKPGKTESRNEKQDE